ncbi:hypothetical protein JIQ42_00162 [Leishmania sp. Namibia]|uniref:hypothetical protein n=1 Tax=Leishmania sp. Namibia TaxID=2802991 RepID=UPI001B622D71|nr:hypothetical protein JIQ42_00162 [Leishmania sp. Namibia]
MPGKAPHTPFPATTLSLPSLPLGASAAFHGVQLERPTQRLVSGEENPSVFEHVSLSSFSASQRRTVSPAKHNARMGVQGLSGAVLEDTSLQMSPGAAANSSARCSPLLSGSAGPGESVQVPSPSAFENPDAWLREYALLRTKLRRPADSVNVYHDYAASLNSRATMRRACVVRPLPDLEKVQEALCRRLQARTPASLYDMCEQQCAAGSCTAVEWDDETVSVAATSEVTGGVRGVHREQRSDVFLPPATVWCVGGSTYENEVVVCNAVTGQRLFRILEPKMKVAVTAMQHAPFRGFMEAHQRRVVPVRVPQDVLRLKATQLVFTDYVWCGLQDGTVRLVPANHHQIRACGASSSFFKTPSAAIVYELPRCQGGAIVSIVCSPCHDAACAYGDSPTWGLPNRVSDAVRCMTAASSAVAENTTAAELADATCLDTGSRQHLSLVCTAATDASVVIWDLRHVYEAVARAQQQQPERKEGAQSDGASALRHATTGPLSFGGPAVSGTPSHYDACRALPGATGMPSDIITFDCTSPVPGLQNMQVRSSCTLVQVKPLAKLSGGFAGLTALRWVSSLVVAGGCGAPVSRDARMATRDARTAPRAEEGLPRIELTQAQTRFDKREAQRGELGLTEEEMQGVERELEHMMPPLVAEPAQSLRVNLLVAADCMGTLHVWNLDEELHRCSEAKKSSLGWPASFGACYYCSLRSKAARSDEGSCGNHGNDAPRATPPTSFTGARRASESKGHSGARKSKRDPKSRRACRGLGLAEARENRARLSELPSNSAAPVPKCDGEAATKRRSLQRLSIGRSANEEREPPQAAQWRLHQTTSERASDRLSNGHGTVPAIPSSRNSRMAASATAHQHAQLRGGLLPHCEPSAKNAGPGPGSTKRKKVKKTGDSLQEASVSRVRSPQPSTSRSRGSAQRPSPSPGLLSELNHSTQRQTSTRLRASVQRSTSVAPKNGCSTTSGGQDLLMPAQAAKCQIRFEQGAAAAIADVVVDLPPQIRTTLRRVPTPSYRVASWQHRPTEEEMDARVLENEFEELTEDKALFFAFQRLEMYVAVDGAMSAVRCVPHWLLPDDDERELFRQRNSDGKGEGGVKPDVEEPKQATGRDCMAEVAMADCVSMGTFDLRLSKRLLDVHVQPITQLFLDKCQGLLWVAREDGFVSIFATRDKSVVSHMAHPSADALLAPTSAQEWAKLQAQAQMRSRLSDTRAPSSFGLECHKECRGLPRNHLTQVLPIAMRPQRALLLRCHASSDGHKALSDFLATATVVVSPSGFCQRILSLAEPVATRNAIKPAALKSQLSSTWITDTEASSSEESSARRTCGISALVCMDGRSDMKHLAKSREAQQWRWLRHLQLCRTESAAVCQTQRRRYYALCHDIGRNVAHVIQELGQYASQSHLRTYFHLWRDHLALFHHTHLMRRQRTARLERERALAFRLEDARRAQVLGSYYLRWQRLLAAGQCRRQEEALARFARAAVVIPQTRHTSRGTRCRGPLPTASMMEHFHRLSAMSMQWRAWQAWTAARRLQQHPRKGLRAVPPYPLPLSRTRSLASSAASMLTPPRHVQSAYRSSAADLGAEGVTTPYRPIHSGGAYVCATSPLSPLGSTFRTLRSGGEAVSLCSARAHGAADTLPVAPAPPPALELLLAELLRARIFVFYFSDARSSATSVLDESWTVILENAESGAESDDDDDRRFSVFRFALLPLLQGLMSTADHVLPNLFDESVAEEVMSMLVGIALAMDYVTANAEDTWWTLREAAVLTTCSTAMEGAELLRSTFDASLVVLRSYAMRAFASDPEAAEVLRGLAKGKKVLAQFLDFAMERAVARRLEHF